MLVSERKLVDDGGSGDFLELLPVFGNGLRGLWEVQFAFSIIQDPSVIKSIYLSFYLGRFCTTNYLEIIFIL
jgi:hypothetical protein